MIFNRNIPREDAEVIDLYEEKELYIEKALSLNEISKEAYEYLEPGRKAGYSFQAAALENQNM